MKNIKEFIVYGKQPVVEALRSEYNISKIILAKELDQKISQFIERLCRDKNLQIVYDTKANLQKFCGPVLHQGIIAYLDNFNYLSEEAVHNLIQSEEKPFFLILDQIQDPHNLGAIIRTAVLAGVTAIILSAKGSAEITPTVAKTSAGAIFHAKVYRSYDLFRFIRMIKSHNVSIFALSPNKDNTIYDTNLNQRLALVIGSEGGGVRKNLVALCDDVISIPRFGNLDSLNASVSTAIVLFETVRQRNFS